MDSNKIIIRCAAEGDGMLRFSDEFEAEYTKAYEEDLEYYKVVDLPYSDGHLPLDLVDAKAMEIAYWGKENRHRSVLIGYLMRLQYRIFGYLELLDEGLVESEEFEEMFSFVEKELFIPTPGYVNTYSDIEKIDYLYNLLNRPIRVFHVGGGSVAKACWVTNADGEPALIFDGNSEDIEMAIACWDFAGESFDMNEYGDDSIVKAGFSDGAMAGFITIGY